jgi:hypothetical protein
MGRFLTGNIIPQFDCCDSIKANKKFWEALIEYFPLKYQRKQNSGGHRQQGDLITSKATNIGKDTDGQTRTASSIKWGSLCFCQPPY